jgi:hypothetical protein
MAVVGDLCSAILVLLALTLSYFLLWARIDSSDELSIMNAWDIVIGLMLSGAFLLARLSNMSTAAPKKSWVTVAGATAILVIVSGGLITWHEAQVRIRSYVSPQFLALNKVKMVQVALQEYAKDCGSFPTQAEGLGALCINPGFAKWKGPYLEANDLIDPWGNPLQYSSRDNVARVWSSGPDRISGTADDVHLDENELRLAPK